MLGRDFVPAKSALDIVVKDMGLVREAAGEQGFRTPLADAAHRLYQVGSRVVFPAGNHYVTGASIVEKKAYREVTVGWLSRKRSRG